MPERPTTEFIKKKERLEDTKAAMTQQLSDSSYQSMISSIWNAVRSTVLSVTTSLPYKQKPWSQVGLGS